jgi:hypothetical protein
MAHEHEISDTLQNRKAYVPRALSQAWAGETAELARRRLKTLIQWLERNGESGAAASLREGLEKTLTVLKLGLPPALRTFLVTTNAIENLMGSARRISRNVTRWRAGEMISRWTAAGPLHTKQGFHRIKGYRHLPLLARALRAQASQLDATVEAAEQCQLSPLPSNSTPNGTSPAPPLKREATSYIRIVK